MTHFYKHYHILCTKV